MTPQELRSSILQLAIQGKLVEQRPEEGTAEELYQQIRQEKQRLIKEGKIKKENPLPEVTEDEVMFDIPDSWKWCRIADVLCLIRGITFPGATKSKTPLSGCVQCATTGSVQSEYNEDADVYVPIEYVKNDSQWLQHEDIMISSANSKELVGKSCQWTGKNKTSFGGFLTIARPFDRNQSKYLFYYFRFLHWSGYFARVSTQTTNIANINNSILSKTLVPLPPLAEQERIVAKIEELMPYIDRYEQAWSKLEDFNKRFPVDMQKSILQMAIQGKLVEQRSEEGTGEELYQQIQAEKQKLIKEGKIKKEKPLPEIAEDEVPFEIPETWKWARLGDISWFFDAGKSPNCEKRSVSGSEWGVITTTAIQLGFFDDVQNKVLPNGYSIKESMQIKCGDILITRAGPTNRTGIACLVKNIRYNLILSDKTLRINMTDKHICKDYIIMVLNSPQIRNVIIGLMSGMDKQQVNISQDKYKTLLIPLPPIAEQERIVARLEELLPLCERLK